jgi:hypothetical protein
MFPRKPSAHIDLRPWGDRAVTDDRNARDVTTKKDFGVTDGERDLEAKLAALQVYIPSRTNNL